MDAFGDNFDQNDIDPAAEFLAREQDQLAGLEDELKPASTTIPTASQDDSQTSDSVKGEHSGSFEMIDNLGQPESESVQNINSEIVDSTNDGLDFGYDAGRATPSPPMNKVVKEEPEKIKKWREEQKKRLEEKDAEEEKKKEEWREIAKKELEDWYRHHEEQIAKTKAANRNAEKQFVAEVDEIEPGTEWERIAKLCDFNPKASKTSKDVSRMRSIILQLKQNPPQLSRAKKA
ncbi:clathrin light chain isoform X2 [Chrysoperla carnea]|uniref:clathrin light chain isoform X2 n=1 Tax=Chrysoperla carnea TaxID=189513 RepID=UPI001D076E2E|nr:clathrin light chain isoform X2 [Chrysoperla carnea]